jgi:branched-chain amino acid transport system ATP-binding protein
MRVASALIARRLSFALCTRASTARASSKRLGSGAHGPEAIADTSSPATSDTISAQTRARMGIGYIPQGRDVFPRLTVRENLLVGEMARRGGTPDYDKVYEFFPILKERAKQAAGTLSGGQQQQLAIGRAMVGGPDLMLLDEPSEGIQPSIVKDIARNIRRLNADTGLTVLFVEQNLDLIVNLAQRGFVIDKGRIIAEVAPDEIRDREKVKKWLAL